MARYVGSPPPRGERDNAPHGDRWEDYFETGERLIWQGAPASGIVFSLGRVFISVFGLVFFSFAAMWISMALGMNSGTIVDIIFPAFGLPFAGIGLALMLGPWFGDAYLRKNTRYALTNKRGIIARTIFGRKMKSYPILKTSNVELIEGDLDTVYFFEIPYKNKDGQQGIRRIGFHQISGGAEVYRMIRALQSELNPE